jgi:hypothetical protein
MIYHDILPANEFGFGIQRSRELPDQFVNEKIKGNNLEKVRLA